MVYLANWFCVYIQIMYLDLSALHLTTFQIFLFYINHLFLIWQWCASLIRLFYLSKEGAFLKIRRAFYVNDLLTLNWHYNRCTHTVILWISSFLMVWRWRCDIPISHYNSGSKDKCNISIGHLNWRNRCNCQHVGEKSDVIYIYWHLTAFSIEWILSYTVQAQAVFLLFLVI